MLSPMPLEPTGAEMTSPAQLLASPTGWPGISPGLGRSPGQYVVQEGRLSLEVNLNLVEGDFKANLSRDADKNLVAHLENALAQSSGPRRALQKQPSGSKPEFATTQAAALTHKLTPAAISENTGYHLDQKNAMLAKLTNENERKLMGEMHQTVANAKYALGLQSLDSSKLEAHLAAALTENAGAAVLRNDSFEPQALLARSNDADSVEPATRGRPGRPRRGSKRFRDDAVTPIEPELQATVADEDLSPRKRRQRITQLSDELHQARHVTNQLDKEIREQEAAVAAALEDNEGLWKMLSYFNACVHYAILEQREEALRRDKQGEALTARKEQNGMDVAKDDNERVATVAKPLGGVDDNDGAANALEMRVDVGEDAMQQQVESLPAFTPGSMALVPEFQDTDLKALNMFISPDGVPMSGGRVLTFPGGTPRLRRDDEANKGLTGDLL